MVGTVSGSQRDLTGRGRGLRASAPTRRAPWGRKPSAGPWHPVPQPPPPSPGTPRPPAHGFFPALPLALGSNRSPDVPRIPEPPAPDTPDSQLGRLLFALLFFVSPFPVFFCVISSCSPFSITLRLSPPLVTPSAPSLDSGHPPNPQPPVCESGVGAVWRQESLWGPGIPEGGLSAEAAEPLSHARGSPWTGPVQTQP